MIFYPQTYAEANELAEFMLERAYVQPTPDMKCMAWREGGKNLMVVAFNAFMGRVCQIHVAMADGFHFSPREFLRALFHHAFVTFGVRKLLGIVNSKNTRALRYDLHIGFVEEYRLHGLHDDGGDIVIVSMTPEQCRYLEKPCESIRA